ncbi:MAG: C4-dicarboxylic acid transporter DauA [Phycisphaerae bacterium]
MSATDDIAHHSPTTESTPLTPGFAVRTAFRRGYGLADLRADVMAGVVVGIIALPLSMALAIASGVPPQHGLYTAIVAGAVIALLGGSKVQVSGPTAAFVVVLAPVAAKFGVGGLAVASLLAGVLLVLMAVARAGKLIEFIPYPVTTGFTSGIAVVIASLQIRDFFGLTLPESPQHFVERISVLGAALGAKNWLHEWSDFAIGALTLLMLIFWPKVTRRIPAPIVALPLGAIVAFALSHALPGFSVATVNSRFTFEAGGGVHQGIPNLPPLPQLPWFLPGAGGAPLVWSMHMVRELLMAAFAIAMLGAIESLLSAVIADSMTGKKHDPDAELLGQGVGNIVAPFFGGFAATGALARTATNIRAGARSPIAALTHSLFVLAAMVALAPLLGYLPMAALAAMLLMTAWNMSELRHFVRMLRVGPRSDVVVLLMCFLLTVLFDMVIAVGVGVVLAALIFMRRMADVAKVSVVANTHERFDEPLPAGVLLFEVAGPMFFGAAHKAMSALGAVRGQAQIVLLDLRNVPVMDATALVNLESTLDRLHAGRTFVIIAGVQDEPLKLMAKAGWKHRPWLAVYRSFEEGVALARLAVDAHAPITDVHSASGVRRLHR